MPLIPGLVKGKREGSVREWRYAWMDGGAGGGLGGGVGAVVAMAMGK